MIFPTPKQKHFTSMLWNWKFYQEYFIIKDFKVDIR